MIETVWGRLAVNVVVGTVAGGVTNAVAVWMLFHPYERRFGLHGAIPKNKPRLAKAIGRTVGEKLLTADDIVVELQGSGLRETVDEALAAFLEQLMARDWPPLRDLLPPTVLPEVERALEALVPPVGEAYGRFVETPEFEERVVRFVARVRDELAPVAVRALLTPERRAELAAQAAGLATELVEESRAAEGRSMKARLGDLALRLAGSERTRDFVERTVADALARAEERTWGELLAPLEDRTVAGWIVAAARAPRARELAAESAGGVARRLLEAPLGRLDRFIPPEAAHRIAQRAAPALWDWMLRRLPELVARVDLQGIVERKVLGFSVARVEEIVRSVTQRELDLIVNLGYVLGAIIGVLTWAVGEAVN